MMTPTETIIYNMVKKLYWRYRAAIKTGIIADMVGFSERQLRRYLVHMEAEGLIIRRGKRGGWLPAS